MESNRRILIVDDQEDLRQQVAKMLRTKSSGGSTTSLIEQIRSRISKGRESNTSSQVDVQYEVDTVGQGRDAYDLVKDSFTKHKPYALMFLDMRMPPGWDGLETAQRIRSIDKEIQIVIMTAYADHEQREIAEKIGEPDKLIYIKKPFHPEEVRQLALAMTEKWNMNRREKERMILTNRLMRENSFLTRYRFKNLKDSFRTVLDSFISFLDARSGALIQRNAELHSICSATSPDDGKRIRDALPEEVRNSSKTITDEDKGTAFFAITFDGFDGYLYIEGKNLVFPFEQLRPFLDILIETTREVLINAFLQQQQSVEKQLAAVGLATGKISVRFKEAVLEIQKCADLLPSAEKLLTRTELARKIHEATDAVIRLTDEVNVFSAEQVRDLELEKCQVSEIITEALAKFELKIEAQSVAIETNIAEDLVITCDRAAVVKALSNIILNSLEAISRSLPTISEIKISANYLNSFRNAVSITIIDNGGGISDTIIGHVFEPFVSLTPETHNGLGVTIAKQLIDRHNGILAYNSEEEVGTTFQVVLPISPDSQISGTVSGKLS
jgi:signal transduction histidine kinase/DNA-binding NarL/FixJ family response regulator